MALTLAPTALAQLGPLDPAVTAAFDSPPVQLGASNSTVVNATITNTGTTGGTVQLALVAPDGWTATVEPASAFSLAAGASAPATITLTAPTAGAGAAAADLQLDATITDQAGRSATATATLGVTRVDPVIPPPPTPWYQTPLGIGAIVGTTLLLLGAALYARHRRNQRLAAEEAARQAAAHAAYLARETGIGIEVLDGPREYGHRREVIYRLGIANKSDRPRVALVEVVDISNGWRASTSVARLPLSAGEKQTVTLCVTPDAVITPGDRASVTVRTKPEEAKEKDERVTLEVVAPKSGVPTDPHYRIVTVHREGANKPLQR